MVIRTSGKLPLPSRAPHVVGCVFFFAALVAGSYFVISARSAPPGQAANFTFVECVPFLPAFPIGGYSASLTPAEQAVSHVFDLAWMGPFFFHSEVLALKPGFLAAVQTLGGKAALDKSSAIFTPIM